jgi:hypothetical protein
MQIGDLKRDAARDANATHEADGRREAEGDEETPR